MFCTNCGYKLEDDQKFCPQCGTPVKKVEPVNTVDTPANDDGKDAAPVSAPTPAETPVVEPIPGEPFVTEPVPEIKPAANKGKLNKKVIIGIIAAVLVLIVGVGVVFGVATNNKAKDQEAFDANASTIISQEIPDCVSQLYIYEDEWNETGLFDSDERQAILEKLDDLIVKSEQAQNVIHELSAELATIEAESGNCVFADAEYQAYTDQAAKCKAAIEGKNPDEAKAAMADVRAAYQQLVDANDTYVDNLIASYGNVNMNTADKDDVDAYNASMQAIEDLKRNHKYAEITAEAEKANEVYYKYITPANPLYLDIQQIDTTDYPHVRLYASVNDRNGNVVENLDSGLFYIRKQDANRDYIKQQVVKATQLSEKESLNIRMVADVSGSMWGDPLMTAQSIMADFLDSVQFHAGDMVELISFSDGVYIEQTSTNDVNLLKNSVYGLYAQNMTALYDALYTAVNKAASSSGAKCVIAFTDGLDNYSSCSSYDVIDLAKRYHIPVFIIGIGYDDFYEARNIATSTGGIFYKIDSVYGMQDIYSDIYRQEKQLYVIEFEDSTDVNLFSESSVVFGYHSAEFGGEINYQYTPYKLANVNQDAFYRNGPEAVVAAYMIGFADAMTEMNYGYIQPYILAGSAIETEQQKYVMRGISEVLESYEIESVDYTSTNDCIVTTRETYFVQKENEPLKLLTQRCKYNVQFVNNSWFITSFADRVEVLTNIKGN